MLLFHFQWHLTHMIVDRLYLFSFDLFLLCRALFFFHFTFYTLRVFSFYVTISFSFCLYFISDLCVFLCKYRCRLMSRFRTIMNLFQN